MFLFMSASLFLQLGWLVCMVVELYAPSTDYIPWSNSIYGHWHCLGAMTLILALRHIPEFPPGTLRFSVYGWVASLVLFWIAPPKDFCCDGLSSQLFSLDCWMVCWWISHCVGGFYDDPYFSTGRLTSVASSLSLMPMVAAYDHTDARWGVVEACLTAPPGLGAPEVPDCLLMATRIEQ